MTDLVHGGDIYSARGRYGGAVLDFSANINPLGIPPGVREVLSACADACEHYPDPLCRDLTRAIAKNEGIPAEHILCGNGAADLIFRYCYAQKPRRALLMAPAFMEYEQALRAVDCEIVLHILHEGDRFCLTRSILNEINGGLDVLFLCNPNNPTGQLIPRELLIEILILCRKKKITLILDECFIDFLERPQDHTLKGCLKEYKNLVILRAFTKIYAIPGIRLGHLMCTDAELLDKMQKCAQPWSVSVPAQLAGIRALEETGYLEQTRRLISTQREQLKAGLTNLGFEVVGGEANFVFFRAPGQSGLRRRMEHHGILIRSCANYRGLGNDYYRIAVRDEADNDRLLSALRKG